MAEPFFVYVDLNGETHFTGRLWFHATGSNESASFEYAPAWRKSPFSFALEPALQTDQSAHHTPIGKALFGSMGDSAPDRWGRNLMKREAARQAKTQNTTPRTLREIDYLLMVNDEARIGALRFSKTSGGPFMAAETEGLPPVISLGKLLQAAGRVEDRLEMDQDIQDIFAPGSSLGGARPKAAVRNTDGTLRIAKFPSQRDEWDVEFWEYIALKIAEAAGIQTPNFELQTVKGKNVLLMDRFDRGQGNIRIPYLSAMSMLQYKDGEQASYLEIAEALSEYGANASEDKKELWLRIVLNILISNYDDHLRNHGFLYQGTNGWKLSPVFDLEPTPAGYKARHLHTFIGLEDTEASLDEALAVAEEFGLSLSDARSSAQQVGKATQTWRRWATQQRATADEIDRMATAFEHDDLRKALAANKVHVVPEKIKPLMRKIKL